MRKNKEALPMVKELQLLFHKILNMQALSDMLWLASDEG
jgi:hypothetical protein